MLGLSYGVIVHGLTDKERQDLLYKQTVKIKAKGINVSYDGLIPKIRKSMFSKDVDSLQPHIKAFVERAAVFNAPVERSADVADTPAVPVTEVNSSESEGGPATSSTEASAAGASDEAHAPETANTEDTPPAPDAPGSEG